MLRLLERTAHAARIGAWELDLVTHALRWTSEMFRLHEVTPDEYTPAVETALAFLAPESVPLFVDALQRGIERGEAHDLELEIITTGGRRVAVRAAGSVETVRGQPARLEGIFQDISERRQAEMERDQFFNLSLDLLCVAAFDGYFKRVNPAFERTLGLTAEELLSRPFLERVHPDDRAATARALEQLSLGVDVVHFENRYLRSDGTYRWFSWLAPAPQGDQIFASARDITEQKAILDSLVAAREAAVQATLAKSQFLANMSHEVRTPMNGVVGMTSLLLETDLSASQREYVDVIRGGAESMLTIVNGILDYSKVEAGKIELELAPLDVARCVEDALDLVALQASAKGLDLSYTLDDAVPALVIGDVTRLRQILVNLLGNAVKFTSTGEVTVSVTARSAPEGDEVVFIVEDTGIGIPRNALPLLFDPFSQVDASTTRRFGGTGLGLAICKRLCELMGGWIAVESEPGAGTAVRFAMAAVRPSEPGAEVADTTSRALHGARVLVVDDSEGIRRSIGGIARRLGASVTSFAVASDALAHLGGASCDVLLLDRDAPRADALALARELDRHGVPLVLLVPLGGSGSGELAAAASGLLTKPPKRHKLIDALLAALGTPSRRAPLRAPAPSLPEIMPPARVLLVDDNAVNQRVGALMLEKLGYRPDLAASGIEAVAALHRQPYDIVFMDVQMPELDGLAATRRIRERLPLGAGPYIIAVTAAAHPEDRDRCQAAGMDDYLAKPFRIGELKGAITRALDVLGERRGRGEN